MFFGQFPLIRYTDKFVVRNVFKSVTTKLQTAERHMFYGTHYITDGERPDILASQYYQHPKYAWVILIVNNMSEKDWPLTEKQLDRHIDNLYGDTRFHVRHYVKDGKLLQLKTPMAFVDSNGEPVAHYFNPATGLGADAGDFIVANGTPVTNEEYEIALNEQKREIRILKRQYLTDFVSEFSQKIG